LLFSALGSDQCKERFIDDMVNVRVHYGKKEKR
jgi:hypothetical protein